MTALEREERSRRPYKPTKGEKVYWHPYSLRALSPKGFTSVTTIILNEEYGLIPLRANTGIQYNQSP